MFSLIGEILRLLVTAIYVKFRKTKSAKVYYTGYDYSYTVKMNDYKDQPRFLLFESRQVKTKMTYVNKMFPKSAFTYEVQLSEYIAGNLFYREKRTFPQLCVTLLNGTIYPHLCAINAHIDSFEYWDRA